jgi:nitrogen fixation/metabolism regulation signal transduction histidine kinase
MKTYLLYIVGLVALTAALAVSIQSRLLWPSIALAVALLWLCVSLYGRMGRILYAYRETERENERLHTRQAEAERQLHYLRQLTENVDTALFVCSTDGRIDWMNHAGDSLLSLQLGGRHEAQKASPSWGRLEGDSFLPPHILQAIADHEEVVDGCALSTVLLRIDGQHRLVVALKDVSMLMQRQEMEAWQQLIRVLTHEIMNSLTPIISISETMGTEAFAVINRRCHALLDFVESYRQLTRIKAPEKTTFPVGELLEHIKGLYPQMKTQGEGLLTADRAQLEQVLINLIKNAYESEATEVELTVHPLPSLQGKATGRRAPLGRSSSARLLPAGRKNGAGGGSSIRIKDNGYGMSPDVVDHAFIPFFTTKSSGTGIGLSLCRQIILKHGGTIRVESEEGKGTTFIITLPSHS